MSISMRLKMRILNLSIILEASQVCKPVKEGVKPVQANELVKNENVSELILKITDWHYDRNLIHGSSDKDQYLKLIQEAGELSDNICKGRSITDDIGDMIVVLINIAERNRMSIEECLEQAWNDIKDRKGYMRDGVFIKEEK